MDLARLAAADALPTLQARLANAALPFALTVREEDVADLDRSAALYQQTREAELSATGWTAAQIAAFTRQQFNAQHAHYKTHYPRAQFLLLLSGATPIGRVYCEQTSSELRLMEITLDVGHRNQGIGSAMSSALLAHAMHCGIAMGLHVEPFNPAKRLYDRQGFRDVDTRGIYVYMRREASPVS